MRNTFARISFVLLLLGISGCIRLMGTAGYSYQGKEDDSSHSKQVTLDTEDIVNPNRAKGNIEVAE